MATGNSNVWPFSTTKCTGLPVELPPLWQGHIALKKSVGPEEIAAAVAAYMNGNPYTVLSVYRFTDMAIIEKLRQGYSVSMELVGFVSNLKGSFGSADAPFSRAKNSLTVSAYAKPQLRDCLNGVVTLRNSTLGLKGRIVSIQDNVAMIEGVVTVPSRILVGGSGLLIGNLPDEFCHLQSKKGEVVLEPQILANTDGTLDLDFGTLPEDGEYTLVVSARSGASEDLAPAVSRIAVTVRRAG